MKASGVACSSRRPAKLALNAVLVVYFAAPNWPTPSTAAHGGDACGLCLARARSSANPVAAVRWCQKNTVKNNDSEPDTLALHPGGPATPNRAIETGLGGLGRLGAQKAQFIDEYS